MSGKRFWSVIILAVVVSFFVLRAEVCAQTPFLACDSQTGIQTYKFEYTTDNGLTWKPGLPTPLPASTTAQADGSLKLDLATCPVGAQNIRVRACKTDPVWGEQCSSPSPFTFTRPSPPVAPVNLRLTP